MGEVWGCCKQDFGSRLTIVSTEEFILEQPRVPGNKEDTHSHNSGMEVQQWCSYFNSKCYCCILILCLFFCVKKLTEAWQLMKFQIHFPRVRHQRQYFRSIQTFPFYFSNVCIVVLTTRYIYIYIYRSDQIWRFWHTETLLLFLTWTSYWQVPLSLSKLRRDKN